MALPTADTIVTYPAGATEAESTVIHVEPHGDRLAVILDRTAFHPIDHHWPDQPADRGQLVLFDGTRVDILDAVVGATGGGRLHVGADVPVRTGTEGWSFVVVHLVPLDTRIEAGDPVTVVADAAHRAVLSTGHTACHLASLALDRALAGWWTKSVPVDSLGAPAFDMLAIVASEILERGSRDTYRVGRSLRKKGFEPAAFDDPVAVAGDVNAILAEWVATAASVTVDVPDASLSARRAWVCTLPDGQARIPCGGTHVAGLAELGEVGVRFDVADADGARTIVMTTTAGR